jgi:hypothetical protein
LGFDPKELGQIRDKERGSILVAKPHRFIKNRIVNEGTRSIGGRHHEAPPKNPTGSRGASVDPQQLPAHDWQFDTLVK